MTDDLACQMMPARGTRYREMSIQRALEWAFGTEFARVDFDQTDSLDWDIVMGGRDTLSVLADRAILGCKVDGGGSSEPHPDAQSLAAAVKMLPDGYGGRRMAIQIMTLARAGRSPDWIRNSDVRVKPRTWAQNQHGRYAVVEDLPEEKKLIRGRVRRYTPQICPIIYTPDARTIAAARRNYLDWWGALTYIAWTVAHWQFDRIVLTDAMPPMTPWIIPTNPT
ncbi:hypothetical protein [Ketogulonicigenium vulgare]|uniref:hypothetical protein n=1 Tax=Ketogulonicigenium vulgare TaxID=92945 RepID=UPI002358AECC|nr:hypothetical protein [Ketogulonicigenium vulgare]